MDGFDIEHIVAENEQDNSPRNAALSSSFEELINEDLPVNLSASPAKSETSAKSPKKKAKRLSGPVRRTSTNRRLFQEVSTGRLSQDQSNEPASHYSSFGSDNNEARSQSFGVFYSALYSFNSYYSCPEYSDAEILKELGFFSLLTLLATLSGHLFDIVTDFGVAFSFYSDEKVLSASLVLAILVLNSCLMSWLCFCCLFDNLTLQNFRYMNTKQKIKTVLKLFCILLQGGPLAIAIQCVWNRAKTLYYYDQKKTNLYRYHYKKYIRCTDDLAVVKLLESFVEAGPQAALQMFLFTTDYWTGTELGLWALLFRALSIGFSIFCLSSTLLNQEKCSRRSKGIPMGRTLSLILLTWRFGLIASRVIVLSLFSRFQAYYFVVFIIIHTICIVGYNVGFENWSFGVNKAKTVILLLLCVFIQFFTPYLPGGQHCVKNYIFWYIVNLLEDSAVIVAFVISCNCSSCCVLFVSLYCVLSIIGVVFHIIYSKLM